MCDALAATGPHTLSGATVFGKNSDRKAGECQPFVQLPAAMHPPGSRVRCTHVEIPQVAETYRVMGHSPWWVWGFEHGVNEHAVAAGNLTVFSKEPVEAEPGLIGMDLVRLGLERGRTARETLEVIAGLLESHGQGGAALAPDGAGYHNAFLLADPDEAWVMQTSGRRWAARRVGLDALSNHLSLGRDWEIGSRDLETFARAEGWWREGRRIDVSAAYRNPHVPGRISEGRLRRSRALLAEHDGSHDVASMQRILRDHLDGGPVRQSGATVEEERYFTLCMHSEPVGTTTASLVAELPASRRAPWPVWISFGTPCTGVFLPVYMEGVVPDALARGGGEPPRRSEDGRDADGESAWWTFHALQTAAERDLAATTPGLRRGWAELEARLEVERKEAEEEARSAMASGDEDGAARVLTGFMQRAVDDALRHARSLRERIAR